MIRCDALIVGGGPAGSTCARMLHRAGWNVVVIDRARFPRDKVCAGWLTPAVFPLLDLDPDEYRRSGLTFQEIRAFRTGVIGGPLIETRYPSVVSYAIRRCEFDHFLLRRSGARVLDGTPVDTIRRDRGRWIVNDAIEAPVLVGAGGHFCPVARFLRGAADDRQPVVAKEAEFVLTDEDLDAADGGAPELFFCRDLEGYAWRVRKGRFLNVGIGRRDPRQLGRHLSEFLDRLEPDARRRARLREAPWRGHAYFAAGVGPRPLVADGVLVAGDAAGLAYPESGEGICPAIESGRRAAEVLLEAAAAGGRRDTAALRPYADAMTSRHPAARGYTGPAGRAIAAAGRILLKSHLFTRHVVLDRWFLRTAGPASAPACLRTPAPS